MKSRWSRGSIGRRLMGWAAIYVFSLHTILAGMIGPAISATTWDVLGELCATSRTGDAPNLPVPAKHKHDAAHCILCSGAHEAAGPPPTATIIERPLTASLAVAFQVASARGWPARYLTKKPRGPPHAV